MSEGRGKGITFHGKQPPPVHTSPGITRRMFAFLGWSDLDVTLQLHRLSTFTQVPLVVTLVVATAACSGAPWGVSVDDCSPPWNRLRAIIASDSCSVAGVIVLAVLTQSF